VRKWVDTLANQAIVRKWTRRLGAETVESFIDACLSLENLIDPQPPFLPAATHVAPSAWEGPKPTTPRSWSRTCCRCTATT
jgi:spore cortex formation protein SpoVR/YcgB (stage V sporulation)